MTKPLRHITLGGGRKDISVLSWLHKLDLVKLMSNTGSKRKDNDKMTLIKLRGDVSRQVVTGEQWSIVAISPG